MLPKKARLFSAGLLFLLLPLIVPSHAFALDVPSLRGRVNDYAGLLPAAKAQELEARLARFEQETGHQIAVLTLPSLEGDSLEEFSVRVAESWKIGQKGFDNGAILVIVPRERKLRIEVGYGLEGVLPDAVASRIIREVIVPQFRADNYVGGIEAGVDAILKITRGEPLPQTARAPAGQRQPEGSPVSTTLILTAILALFIGMTRRRPASGALGGAAAGVVTSLFSGSAFGPGMFTALAIGTMLGALGSGMSVASSSGRQWTAGSRGRRGGWHGGFYPGGFGGGGFGGGGSGGGGFSGGGGGFGGGGASGSW